MKLISFLLIVALLLQPIAVGRVEARQLPVNARAITRTAPAPTLQAGGLPAFPEDAQRPEVDWSALDWDAQIVTPDAEEELAEERERLMSQGKAREAKALKARRVPLHDAEALGFIRPPEEVRKPVEGYAKQLKELEAKPKGFIKSLVDLVTGGEKKDLKEALMNNLKRTAPAPVRAAGQATASEDLLSDAIDLGVLQPMDTANIKAQQSPEASAQGGPAVESVQSESPQVPQVNVIPEGRIKDLRLAPPASAPSAKAGMLSLLVPVAFANEGSSLMNYYDGIEDAPIDFLLLYIAGLQNEDGSIGTSNVYEQTFRMAEILSQMGKAHTDEYERMMYYLRTADPVNNRNKAFKVRVLDAVGLPTDQLMDELAAQFIVNMGGEPLSLGLGLYPGYMPDMETMIAFAEASMVTGKYPEFLTGCIVWISERINPDGNIRYNWEGPPSLHLMNAAAQLFQRLRGLTFTYGTSSIVIDEKVDLILDNLRSVYGTDQSSLLNHDVIDLLTGARTFQMNADDGAITRALRDAALRSQSLDGSFGSTLYASRAALAALPESNVEVLDMSVSNPTNHQPVALTLKVRNTGQLPLWSLKLHVFAGNIFVGTHVITLETPLTEFSERSLAVALPAQFSDTLTGPVRLSVYVEVPSEANENNNWITSNVTFAQAATPAYPLLTQAYLRMVSGQVSVDGQFLYRADSKRSALRLVLIHVDTNDAHSVIIPTTGLTSGSTYGFTATFPTAQTGEYSVQLMAEDAVGTLFTEPAVIAEVQTYDVWGSTRFVARENSAPLPGVDVRALGTDLVTDEDGIAVQSQTPTGRHYTKVINASYEPFLYRYDVRPDVETRVNVMTRGQLDGTAPIMGGIRIVNGPDATAGVFHAPGTHTIEVTASDDVMLRSASIEYRNPQDGQWYPIANVPFETATYAHYEWSVPASLTGTGFTLRAKVADIGGNESTSFESDPFDLVGSSVMTITGFTNGTWGLGETATVNFDFSSIPNVNAVDRIYINSDGYRFQFATSFTGTQKSLTMPLSGTRLSPAAYLEAQIYSNNYAKNTTVFSPLFAVVDRTPAPAAPWHAPTTFADPSPGSLLFRKFEYIDERADGSADVVYSEVDGHIDLGTQEHRRLVFRSLRDGNWQPPVIIASHDVAATADRHSYIRVSVRKDAGDGVHVLYNLQQYADATKNRVFYASVRNQQLEKHEELTSAYANVFGPAFAVSPDGGTVIASWQEKIGSSTGFGNLLVRQRTGSGWGLTDTLAAAGANPALVTDGETASAIFVDDTGLRYRTLSGSTWDQPHPVLDPSGQEIPSILSPRLYENPDGTFDVFFLHNTTTRYHLRHLGFSPVAPAQPVSLTEDHDLVDVTSRSVSEYIVLSTAPREYHLLYTKDNADATTRLNGYLTLIGGQVQQGSNVFPLIRSVYKPMLDAVNERLLAFAEVQESGFSDMTIQRNFADVLAPSVLLPVPGIPDLLPAYDSGRSSTDNLTNKTSGLKFAVTNCTAGATVKLFSGAVLHDSHACTATGVILTMAGQLDRDGEYVFHSVQQNGSDISPAGGKVVIRIDTVAIPAGRPDLIAAHDTGVSDTDNITSKASGLQFTSISCEAGNVVKLYAGVVHRGTSVCTGTGVAITMTGGALAAGTHDMYLRQIDVAGNLSPAVFGLALTILGAPGAPSAPDLIAADDTGLSTTDNITNKTSGLQFVIASCVAGSTVKLYAGTAHRGTGTCTSTGVTVTMTGSALAAGTHALTARQSDAEGNTSAASAVLTVTVLVASAAPGIPDLIPGDDTGVSNSDNITGKTSGLKFRILPCAAGNTVQLLSGSILRGSGTCTSTGVTVTMTGPALADGTYKFAARQVDVAGNVSPASGSLSVTILAPPTVAGTPDLIAAHDLGVSNADNITKKAAGLQFTVTDCEPGSLVHLYVFSSQRGTHTCTNTGVTLTMTSPMLTDGLYEFRAVQENATGTSTGGMLLVKIDTTASTPGLPDLIAAHDTGVSATDNITSKTSGLKFTVTSCEAGATVQLYAGSVYRGSGTCTSTGVTVTMGGAALAQGAYGFTVQQYDIAGNESASSSSLAVIIAAPPAVPGAPNLIAGHDTGVSATDNLTRKTSGLQFVVQGCTPGSTVNLFGGSTYRGSGTCTSTGVTITMGGDALPNGASPAFKVNASNAVGTSGFSAITNVTIDSSASKPSVPDLLPSYDNGVSKTDNITSIRNDLKFKVASCELGATVKLYVGGDHYGTGTCTSNGVQVMLTGAALPFDTYGVRARQVDRAGNQSVMSDALNLRIKTNP